MELELYIEIENGVAINHPILGDNLRQALPDIDTNNLPSNYAKFIRCPAPKLGPYDIYKGNSYELVDGVYTDVHTVEQVADEEKLALQNIAKKRWINAYPDDGSLYTWNKTDQLWVLAPEQPLDIPTE